ncbi:11080_t:CDS:2, partial [Dentiscutata erythropus]
MESCYWSAVSGMESHYWSTLVVVYGTVGSGISLVDPCWSDLSICGV